MNQYKCPFWLWIIALPTLSLLYACSNISESKFQSYYIVDALLIVNKPYPPIRLSQTTPADSIYIYENQAADNATIQIEVMSNDGNADTVIPYQYDNQQDLYMPNSNRIVPPQKTHKLSIQLPDGTLIEGETRTPYPINVEPILDSVVYQGNTQAEYLISSDGMLSNEDYYAFRVKSQQWYTWTKEEQQENTISFYENIVDDDEVYIPSSPPLNSANFEVDENNKYVFKLAWFTIAYYGKSTLIVELLDNNTTNFLRSIEGQEGGRVFISPGELYNGIFSVSNAVGYFGSVSQDSAGVYISR